MFVPLIIYCETDSLDVILKANIEISIEMFSTCSITKLEVRLGFELMIRRSSVEMQSQIEAPTRNEIWLELEDP